jgi:hypothetical protein
MNEEMQRILKMGGSIVKIEPLAAAQKPVLTESGAGE